MLCFNCNQALGNVRDDPAVLRALIEYLDDHRKPHYFVKVDVDWWHQDKTSPAETALRELLHRVR